MTGQLLIATDLDRTLLPNGPEPESAGVRERFASLVARQGITLAYVSGRHRELVEQAMAEYALPVPDFVVADVGTTIYRVGPQHIWQPDNAWAEAIARDWGEYGHAGLAALLQGIGELSPQEAERQRPSKLSYDLPVEADTATLEAEIRARLQPAGVRFRLVWSVDEQKGVGLLDILPEQASKLHALEALVVELGLSPQQTVFCGDSGNDMEVLVSRIPAVLVANSTPEVRALALAGSRDKGFEDRLYIARGGMLGMNGHYAGGMLEGIVHYHPDLFAILQGRANG